MKVSVWTVVMCGSASPVAPRISIRGSSAPSFRPNLAALAGLSMLNEEPVSMKSLASAPLIWAATTGLRPSMVTVRSAIFCSVQPAASARPGPATSASAASASVKRRSLMAVD